MNPITNKIKIGTVGELLVQLRLLEFDVQAAPPLKDSGNDLIAIRGEPMRAIQMKTTARNDGFPFRLDALPKMYPSLAIVRLRRATKILCIWMNAAFSCSPRKTFGTATVALTTSGIICCALM
jgi:hypothetical protein